jgi:hypothetical protein
VLDEQEMPESCVDVRRDSTDIIKPDTVEWSFAATGLLLLEVSFLISSIQLISRKAHKLVMSSVTSRDERQR